MTYAQNMRYAQKVSRVNLYQDTPTPKKTMNAALIFSKIILLAFNTIIPVSFPLSEVTLLMEMNKQWALLLGNFEIFYLKIIWKSVSWLEFN